MPYRLIFAPEAEEQLLELFDYIANAASPDIALRYTNALVSYCENFCNFPYRGNRRDDIRPGLRTTNYRKRTVIAFTVSDATISIIGIFHGGQNYESQLTDE